MKTNYLLKSKPKSNTKKVVGIIVTLCILGVSLQYFFPRFFTTIAHTAVQPVWFLREATLNSFSSFFGYFDSLESLRIQNKNLEEEVARLTAKEFEATQVRILYENLKGVVYASSTTKGVIAKVLSKPPVTAFDVLIINKGSVDGVNSGDLVYVRDALAVGRVSKVLSGSSVVTLFSSPDEVQQFEVLRTGVVVEVYGKGGGNFTFSVPKDFDIVKNDILSEPSSGLSAVATVYAIDETSQNSFKQVYARVPQSLFQLMFVRVDTF